MDKKIYNAKTLRARMYQHIQARQRTYKKEWLDLFTLEDLLPHCHPMDREDYEAEIRKLTKVYV